MLIHLHTVTALDTFRHMTNTEAPHCVNEAFTFLSRSTETVETCCLLCCPGDAPVSAGPSQFLILKEKEQNHLFPQPGENLHFLCVLKPAAEHRRAALGGTRP